MARSSVSTGGATAKEARRRDQESQAQAALGGETLELEIQGEASRRLG